MIAKVFVDTNILLYAYDTQSESKHQLATEALQQLWRTGNGVLSTQVLQEFYVNITKKWKPPMSPPEAREVVLAYAKWVHEPSTPSTVIRASEIAEAYQLSFWDGLILASAEQQDASIILTEDLSHGQRIAGIEIVNPFLHTARKRPRSGLRNQPD